jgi:Tol biopolymer transport system component
MVHLFASNKKGADDAYTIAFGSFAPVRPNLFTADGNGEHVKALLLNPDVDYNASFSRDGNWIVFTSERSGSADVYRVHPDGSGLERLTTSPALDDQGVLSPDGRAVAFVSTRGGAANIWLLDLATRALACLTQGSTGDFRPAWSPDGEWIAFSSDRDLARPKINFGVLDATQIYIMRKNGRDLRRLTTGDISAGSPSWSPDGSRVIYYQASVPDMPAVLLATSRFSPAAARNAPQPRMQIMSTDVRSGATETLAGEPGAKWSPRWLSAAIRTIAYASSGGIDQIGGPPGARGEFTNPNWSTDGTRMVFHRETDSVWPPFQSWSTLDRGFRLIRTGIFPSYSPSGDQLVCNSGIAGIAHNAILLLNGDGSNRRVLFDDPARSAVAPVWSPRGDRIAFALGQFFPMVPGREQMTSRLALIGADGQGLQLLTAAGDRAGFPSWSPDGQRLVYRAADAQGRGLRIIDLATNRVTELTNGPHNDNFPAWSPKGDRIAFATDRDGDYEIYSIRPDGTELRRLTRSRGNDAHLSWSPDGQWIAFASARTGFVDEVLLHPDNGQANGEIFVMRADGSDVRRLTENPWEDATPAWKPLRRQSPRLPHVVKSARR